MVARLGSVDITNSSAPFVSRVCGPWSRPLDGASKGSPRYRSVPTILPMAPLLGCRRSVREPTKDPRLVQITSASLANTFRCFQVASTRLAKGSRSSEITSASRAEPFHQAKARGKTRVNPTGDLKIPSVRSFLLAGTGQLTSKRQFFLALRAKDGLEWQFFLALHSGARRNNTLVGCLQGDPGP